MCVDMPCDGTAREEVGRERFVAVYIDINKSLRSVCAVDEAVAWCEGDRKEDTVLAWTTTVRSCYGNDRLIFAERVSPRFILRA